TFLDPPPEHGTPREGGGGCPDAVRTARSLPERYREIGRTAWVGPQEVAATRIAAFGRSARRTGQFLPHGFGSGFPGSRRPRSISLLRQKWRAAPDLLNHRRFVREWDDEKCRKPQHTVSVCWGFAVEVDGGRWPAALLNL